MPDTGVFIILPDRETVQKFSSKLKKEILPSGARQFKKNSVIGKAWAETMRGMEMKRRPMLWQYTTRMLGRYTERKFFYDGNLYISIDMMEGSESFQVADWAKEIKGSAFHQILEQARERKM